MQRANSGALRKVPSPSTHPQLFGCVLLSNLHHRNPLLEPLLFGCVLLSNLHHLTPSLCALDQPLPDISRSGALDYVNPSDVVSTSRIADVSGFVFWQWLDPDSVRAVLVHPLMVEAHSHLPIIHDGLLLRRLVLEVLVLDTVKEFLDVVDVPTHFCFVF